MEVKDVFYINGSKKLIFRKESDKYITFNPIDLEFYKINIIGAEILYLVSKHFNYEQIVDYFTTKYKIKPEVIRNDIIMFFSSFGCTKIIKDELLKLDIRVNK